MNLVTAQGVAQDQVEDMVRVATFDRYVKPECDTWDQRCIDIHQIHSEDECIVSAHNIDQVWLQFKTWLNGHVGMSKNRHPCCIEWGKLQPQVAVEDYAGTEVMSILPTPDSVLH